MIVEWTIAAAALVVLGAWGVFALARITGVDRLAVVLPGGLLFGAMAFTMLVNGIGRICGIRAGALLVLAGMALWVALRGIRNRPAFLWGAGQLELHGFWIGALGLALLTAVGGSVTLPPDPDFHLPTVATIANGNLPVCDPFVPTRLVEYHFGCDLLAGALASISGLPSWHAWVLPQVLFHVGIWGLLIGWSAWGDTPGPRGVGLWIAGFVYGAAGFRWWGITKTPFGEAMLQAVQGKGAWPSPGDLFESVDLRLLSLDLHGALASDLWGMPNITGFGVFLLCLFLVWRCVERENGWLLASAGVCFGAVELFRQDYFVLAVPAAVAVVLVRARDLEWRRCARSAAVIGGIAGVLALVQGAVLTSMVLGRLAGGPTEGLAFAWKSPPHWVLFDFSGSGANAQRIVPGAVGWTLPFWRDAAAALILFLPAAIWAAIGHRPRELAISVMFLAGTVLALFLDIPRETRATTRLLNFPLANLVVGAFVADLLDRLATRGRGLRIAGTVAACGLLLLTSLSPLGNAIATCRWGLRVRPADHLPAESIQAGRWLREQVPFGARVAGIEPTYSGQIDLGGYIRSRKWKYPLRDPVHQALERRDFAELKRIGVEFAVVRLRSGESPEALAIPPGAALAGVFGEGERRLVVVDLDGRRE